MRDFSDTAILLCAHGDKRGALPDGNLRRLVGALQGALKPSHCGFALLSVEGDLDKKLDQLNESHVIVVPMIFSDGYFYSKIARVLEDYSLSKPEAQTVLLPPICDWPEMAECLSRIIDGSKSLLIAHGSKKSSASRLANERLAARLTGLGAPEVSCSYLEEPPYADVALKEIKEPVVVVGLFMGNGLHGGSDWETALAEAEVEPRLAFTVGAMSELCGLVQEKIENITP